MQPFRKTAKKKYTIRYETLPGEQMQVVWKEVGEVVIEGKKAKLSLFVATLGYSRMKYAVFTTSQDQEHLMECLIQSFKYFGGIPKRVLFDKMRTVTDGREQGVVKWNQRFSQFSVYYGFIPKVCRPYRAQTKGKVERAIQYIMDHFYVGTSFESIEELNYLLQRWLDQVANREPNARPAFLRKKVGPRNRSNLSRRKITIRAIFPIGNCIGMAVSHTKGNNGSYRRSMRAKKFW